jgi:hypothetical protein
MKGSVDNAEPFTLKDCIKGFTELGIIVMDQEVEGSIYVTEFPYQLSGLLGNPGFVWISRGTGEINLARTPFNEEKHIKSLQLDSFDGEEIAGQDLIFVMVDQRTPTNGAAADQGWLYTVAFEYIPNCCLGNLGIKLQEFALDLAISPTWILLG